MLTPKEKSPLPKMSPEEDRTRDTGQRAQALPTELFRPPKLFELLFVTLGFIRVTDWLLFSTGWKVT